MSFHRYRPSPSLRAVLVAATALYSAATLTSVAHAADSPYMAQIPSGIAADLPANFASALTQLPQSTSNFAPAPQFAVPHLSTGNLAQTVEIGNSNRVAQIQTGLGDQSGVGVIGGNNNVGVVQAGNNLQSNLLMIGTQGMSVGILQPPGSAPVNMAIIHTSSGTLIIRR
jgi:hypothetical protein